MCLTSIYFAVCFLLPQQSHIGVFSVRFGLGFVQKLCAHSMAIFYLFLSLNNQKQNTFSAIFVH